MRHRDPGHDDELIQTSHDKIPASRRWLEALLTMSGWVWIASVVLQTAASALLWALGVRQIRLYLVGGPSPGTLLTLLRDAATMALLALLTFTAWAYYNQRRYGALKRRRSPPPVSQEELAAMLQVDESALARLQRSRWVEWAYDATRPCTSERVTPQTSGPTGTDGSTRTSSATESAPGRRARR
ncbi:MAG: poly-beta-1,6-N-acetyl-D-glucosamine biosynthesis protein PgaD [Thermoflavifilum sp.]|nr:poly-beta-1,6-N-acetyl-D-glucosamine biosynthesis protein PgaD [Thermoflavifilum sp.]MCL6514086.1 poly-beta-1,6-N-acetyl-D-glucosamine biosynthesis protein PgaD [Alicyclobacillus sp.]